MNKPIVSLDEQNELIRAKIVAYYDKHIKELEGRKMLYRLEFEHVIQTQKDLSKDLIKLGIEGFEHMEFEESFIEQTAIETAVYSKLAYEYIQKHPEWIEKLKDKTLESEKISHQFYSNTIKVIPGPFQKLSWDEYRYKMLTIADEAFWEEFVSYYDKAIGKE